MLPFSLLDKEILFEIIKIKKTFKKIKNYFIRQNYKQFKMIVKEFLCQRLKKLLYHVWNCANWDQFCLIENFNFLNYILKILSVKLLIVKI